MAEKTSALNPDALLRIHRKQCEFELQCADAWEQKYSYEKATASDKTREEIMNEVIKAHLKENIIKTEVLQKADGSKVECFNRVEAEKLKGRYLHLTGKTIKADGLLPKDKYHWPRTTNQEIGWNWNSDINVDDLKMSRKKKTTDIGNIDKFAV